MHKEIKEKALLKNKVSIFKSFAAIMFLFLLGTNTLFAQQSKITGAITSENNEPLLGVSITVKGTKKATISDFDGNYIIKAKKDDIIVFTSLGYETKEMKVFNSNQINVTLETNTTELDEVIVVGYGTQKKKEVTGAVVKLDAEVLEKTTTSDIGAAMQGQIAGVNVTSSSGEPGSESNIVIRGYSSVMDGQNSPLYVVDGIPYDADPQLSISEIESIDVLKDAASASIYGTRGAGGVILITTKQGKEGEMNIRLNSEYGVQKITSGVDLMSSEQMTYLDILLGAQTSNKEQGQVDADIHRNASWLTNNTDLSKIILNDLASIQNHSLNISGGKKGLTYSFNTNLYEQEGIMINSNYQRLNLRANTKFTKDRWKITTGLTFKKDEKEKPNGNLLTKIYDYKPYQPDIDLDIDQLDNAVEEGDTSSSAKNLGGTVRSLKTVENIDGLNTAGNAQIDFEATDDLTLTVRGGAFYANSKAVKIVPTFDLYDEAGNLIEPNAWDVSSNRTTIQNSSKLTFEAIANYSKKIGKNNFKLMVANSIQKSESEYFYAEKKDNASSDITVFDGYTSSDLVVSDGRDNVRTLIGYLGRLQYNYDGKYILSASIRRDGSSQFSEENRWGWFPSLSLGWNVSDEAFWDPIKPVVNAFKVRASYGSTGNDRFNAYSNQAVVNLGQDYVFGSSDTELNSTSEQVALGTTQEQYANENVKWETSIERNLGYDMSFLKNKVSLSIDYYRSEKKDLLFNVVNPPSTGVSGGNRQSVLNVGNMTNTGLEYAFKYRHRGKNNFSWNTSLTYSQNKNVVTKTSPNNPIIYLDNSYISTKGNDELVSVITEGYEAAAFFLRETDGVIKTQEELVEYQKIDPTAELGELRYVDQNGDGVINQDDKIYMGSGAPDFEMGFNFNANYKNFDFSMQWYGSFGAEVMNGSKAYAYQSGVHQDLYYSWTEANPTSDIPWSNGRSDNASYRGGSDYFLEDGDFVRLRNIALGYSLPKKITASLGVTKLRFYVQAQNPITFTKYTGYDPEVGNNGLSSRGIDRGTYPISSQYKAGLQLQF
ncbi:TonB-linked SusC/RagA family outer membrane protein [Wenyingzhuangia heitensis]|uniref:TonB-linked SusC/RagA family outer membrane protein n=1 Tax=Wenyingzhuangia heitensis TaxID=1487859 RepID=A0ABX0UFW1_9FLAO|nr:TonB-dependent receptor [Wenyingzhuangia heitensis]NIJ45902.1 TonB-linked SusC/RagA family outer membrane protein [Wenyingzhuangia heitensis]